MHVLVVNAGSSSLKLRVLDDDDHVVDRADVGPADDAALREFVARAHTVGAVGHRVVHGGADLVAATLIDDDVLAALGALTPLAPLHQPAAIAGIDRVRELLPHLPSVACFDTAFHATIPPRASTYPVPEAWRTRFGLRRFGFHGLSHAHAARRSAELLGRPIARLVTCHLGAGSSISAVVDGRGVDTTMGFTPNEGVPMATRSGSVDVGMLTWLLAAGISADELDDGLQRQSGLLALAGTADMREIEVRAGDGDASARLALDVWVLRVAQAIAAMAVSAGGIDALTFTGGIGGHSAAARSAIVGALSWLDVRSPGDDASDGDRVLSDPDGGVAVLVVEAREDIEIARQVRALLR